MIPNAEKFSIKQRAKKLKIIGVLILILGISGAGILYWLETRGGNLSDDAAMLGFDRAQTRQMEILYGKSGAQIHELANDLKQPGTQAIIIIIVSALVMGGCFYFARLLQVEDSDSANLPD